MERAALGSIAGSGTRRAYSAQQDHIQAPLPQEDARGARPERMLLGWVSAPAVSVLFLGRMLLVGFLRVRSAGLVHIQALFLLADALAVLLGYLLLAWGCPPADSAAQGRMRPEGPLHVRNVLRGLILVLFLLVDALAVLLGYLLLELV